MGRRHVRMRVHVEDEGPSEGWMERLQTRGKQEVRGVLSKLQEAMGMSASLFTSRNRGWRLGMTHEDLNDRELAAEFVERIRKGDEEAAFDLAQFFLARVVKKDVEAMLDVAEGLAHVSAIQGSEQAREFLSDDWPGLRTVLLKRLKREFSSS